MSRTPDLPEEVFLDGSHIIIEAMARVGVRVYVGYPITPASGMYAVARERMPLTLAAPDEITALQWTAGLSATGTFPITATAFPGFALMLESFNMAFMMELPMVIILAQRLGPSTGSATTGAQGDLLLSRGCISGGYPVPVLCPSDLTDCWELAARSVETAITLRTPVILLTSKEMVMTTRNLNLAHLPDITPAKWRFHEASGEYRTYEADASLVPPFLPVGNAQHQVRFNASTHDAGGLTRKATAPAIENTGRLREKIETRIAEYTYYHYDDDEAADIVLLTYRISSEAARDAVRAFRSRGKHVSLLIMKTLFPVPPIILDIIERYSQVVIIEENLSGLLREMLYGQQRNDRIYSINKIGTMITPSEIIQKVEQCNPLS